MNRMVPCVIAAILVLSPLVMADAALPGDLDGNGVIAREELASSILARLSSGTTAPGTPLTHGYTSTGAALPGP